MNKKYVLSFIIVFFITFTGAIDVYAEKNHLMFKSIDNSLVEQTSDRNIDDISFEDQIIFASMVFVAIFIIIVFTAGMISIALSFNTILRK